MGFVTRDIRASMQALTQSLGVGPWFLRERGVFARQLYRGEPVGFALSIAMGYAGDMQFELIQQLDEEHPFYAGAAGGIGQGLHHFGVATAEFDATCARWSAEGFGKVYEAEVAHGARVAYFDAAGALPAMLEAIEYLPATEAMLRRFQDAARDWDGSEPVRPLAPLPGAGSS